MKKLLFSCAMLTAMTAVQAQRIDINNNQNRTEEDYEGWVVGTVKQAEYTTANGITVLATIDGTQTNRTLKGEWWKDGVNKYSKLTSDGVGVYGLEGGNTPQIQQGEVGITLTISGLSAGQHSLMAYHNNPSGYSGPLLDVYIDGTKVLEGIEQTNRAQTPSTSGQSYVKFTATEGQPVVITYRTTPDPSFDYTQGYNTTSLFINALVFDRPNPMTTAADPTPENYDEHANCDGNSCKLTWTAAELAVRHHVLIGNDPASLNEVGTVTSPSFELTGIDPLHTLYWRIDEEDKNGNVYEGDLWNFRPRRLAFPDAEGYGRFAIGGRGGAVYHVTSLDDNPENPQPGTFRYGITKVSGPRTIVFDVAGTIYLKARLTCSDKYVTIAGQTAPGRGIMLRGCPFGMASDGITRFLRLRRGHIKTEDGTTVNSKGETVYVDANRGLDGMGMAGNDHAIMDHCSISWTIDEGFSSRGAKNITLQRTLISEALNIAGHPNYPQSTAHGYAATIGGGELGGLGSSFHHNLLAHNEGRNWSMSGGLDGAGYYDGHHDMFNNVCYNWGGRATDGGTHEGQFVANYYKMGPATTQTFLLNAQLEGTGAGSQAYYVNGNIRENLNKTQTQDAEGDTYKYTLSGGQKLDWTVFQNQPFFESYATVETAEAAYKNVLSDVGCNQPELDNHDLRMIQETLAGTTSTTGSKSHKKGLIDHEDDAEGFDGLNIIEAQRPANWDTDEDGIPDWYEELTGMDSSTPNNNADSNSNGYTDLEEYLEFKAQPHFLADEEGNCTIKLQSYFAGFSQPIFGIEEYLRYDGTGWMIDENGNMKVEIGLPETALVTLHVVATENGVMMRRAFNIVKSHHPTLGITPISMKTETDKATSVYNLKGQRLPAPQKGLNIQKGRKYMKK